MTLGVATDHGVESFRNPLWPGYRSGAGLEEALAALGVVVWPVVELEADDGLAIAAHDAAGDARVEKVTIRTPDKDELFRP